LAKFVCPNAAGTACASSPSHSSAATDAASARVCMKDEARTYIGLLERGWSVQSELPATSPIPAIPALATGPAGSPCPPRPRSIGAKQTRVRRPTLTPWATWLAILAAATWLTILPH